MTGTAETEANEFKDIYRLGVVVVPTNRDCIRKDADDLIFKTRREKLNALIEEIKKRNAAGQPMLVGTASVESSEIISRMLEAGEYSPQRIECEAASVGGGDCGEGGRAWGGDDCDEHGGERDGH